MRNPVSKLNLAPLVALTLLLTWQGRAEDSFPACWRGNPGTTYQDWFFAVSNNPAAPDAFTNVNGTPLAALTVGPFGTGWRTVTVGGRTGVWDFGQAGNASLTIPNFGGSPPWKYVQVQVTYFDAPGFYLPPVISMAGGTLISSQVTNNQPVAPGNWKTLQTVWLIQPSPASETIMLAGDTAKGLLIDEIIVDTRSAAPGDGDVPAYRPCWRGQGTSTFQQWLFGVSNNPASLPAELVTNAFGTPSGVLVAGPFSAGYIQENPFLGCRQGIWDLGHSGTLTLVVPNTPSAGGGSYKYVRAQVTQYRDPIYNANAAVTIAGGTLVSQQQQTVETTPSGGQWVVAQSIWRLGPPCPASESVVITGGANGSLIDQVTVDTLCLDFACPGNLATVADPGQCSKSNVTWTLPPVNGCTITNVTSTPPSGSTLPVGTNSITILIQDGEGGTKSCVFTVTVADNEPPVARCRNIAVNLNGAGQAVISGADVDNGSTDNCGIATLVAVPSSFNCANLGSNSVTLTVTDLHGNNTACNATVTVLDILPPTLTCPGHLTRTNDPGVCGAMVSYTAPVGTDNCPGVVTAQIAGLPSASFFPVGRTTNTFRATDASSNSTTCSFVVVVQDHEPPHITTCPTNRTLSGCTATVPDLRPEVVATDNCGFTLSQSPAPGSAIVAEVTVVTLTAQDAAGNSATCNVTLQITPPTLDISRSGDDVILTWSEGVLLQALDVTGPWSLVIGAISPYTIPPPLAARKFYRVECN